MARTTHRSTGGKKLYAVRDKEGQFKDIQTYKRAHGQDVKRVSMAETAATVGSGITRSSGTTLMARGYIHFASCTFRL